MVPSDLHEMTTDILGTEPATDASYNGTTDHDKGQRDDDKTLAM